jgi:hypothetical protein
LIDLLKISEKHVNQKVLTIKTFPINTDYQKGLVCLNQTNQLSNFENLILPNKNAKYKNPNKFENPIAKISFDFLVGLIGE